MSTKAKLAVSFGLAALVLVWGAVAWRMRHASEVTVKGDLRLGTLSCPSPCRIELALSDGTRIATRDCALPNALRDASGVHVVAAGTWTSPGVLEASHLFVTARGGGGATVPKGCVTR